MARSATATPGAKPAAVAHCSWGSHAEKRWMTVALRSHDRWKVSGPAPVGTTDDLMDRLRRFVGSAGPVLLGLDFPIGLPHDYGARTGLGDFPTALRALGAGDWADWFSVCDGREQISLHRPFYPALPNGHRRRDLLAGLGLSSPRQLLRRCERGIGPRRSGCGLFWTVGPNQTGKGAVSGWRELLVPELGGFGLWPFDGMLGELLASHDVVVAETFPGILYDRIGLPPRYAWCRKTQPGRAAVAGPLLNWFRRHATVAAAGIQEAILNGFSAQAGGEARFDALVGLLGMLEILDGSIDEGCPKDPIVQRWEGWILGQQSGDRGGDLLGGSLSTCRRHDGRL